MNKTQKDCADLLLLKASMASKGRISKLRRSVSSSNIILPIMRRCLKGRNSKLRRLRRLTTLSFYRGNGEEKQ